MKITNLISCISLFVFLQWSNNALNVNAAIGLISTLIAELDLAEVLWKSQDLSVIENVTIVQIHHQLRHMGIFLEGVALETAYKGVFKEMLSDMIAQTLKIDTDYRTTMDYLKFERNNVSDKAKAGIINFARAIITGVHSDFPFGKYDTLRINVLAKLLPAIKDLNEISQGKFRLTCSKSPNNMATFQQNLLELLKSIKLAELKVFLILKGSGRLLKIYEHAPGAYKDLINQKVHKMKEWSVEMLADFRTILHESSRDLWICDPDVHEEGISYKKLNNVFQKFVINEKNFEGNGKCEQTCRFNDIKQRDTCRISESTRIYPSIRPYNFTCVYSRACAGKLHNCKSLYDELHISVMGHALLCLSNNYSRRYDMISVSNYPYEFNNYKQRIGPKQKCGNNQITIMEDWHIPFNNWWRSCEVCLCTCDDNTGFEDIRRPSQSDLPLTDRYFYKKAVISNIQENYVITGARLTKKNSVIYIQIQQGKLLNEGTIDQQTLLWRRPSEDELFNPDNHHILEWSNRNVELQDINVPAGHVLVGLQFTQSSSGIRLRIFSKPFNFISGIISNISASPIPSEGDSISSGIDVDNLNLPDAKTVSIEVSTNEYVSFGTSNFITDIGQTTIPFLDVQIIQTNTAIPMGGAGLYYKYKPGYSGYLAVKLISYDISQHIVYYDKNEKEVDFTTLSLSSEDTGIFMKYSHSQ